MIGLFNMKNYASRRANKGKTAYRTPSQFRYQASLKNKKAERNCIAFCNKERSFTVRSR